MSYIDFFDFKEHPFRITPDVQFFFASPLHSEALQSLKYFADSNEGFLVLTGEPGTGKTITLRKFMNELPENVEYAYVMFPSLEPEEMFHAVLEDFGYPITENQTKNTLFAGFRDFLTEKRLQGKKTLLIIDEAQNLSERTLEELRILSNLETEKEKLIQFVIAGQPELDLKLDSQALRQLKQRITLRINLDIMSYEEMSKYVSFRLTKASYRGIYPDTAFYKKLYSYSKGNPRLINLLMERALMAAYVDQNKLLNKKHLISAAVSLQMDVEREQPKSNLLLYAVAALLAVVCIAGAAFYYGTLYSKRLTPPPAPAPIAQQEAPKPKPVPKAPPVQKAEPVAPIQPAAEQQTATQASTAAAETVQEKPMVSVSTRTPVTAPKAAPVQPKAEKAAVKEPVQQAVQKPEPAAETGTVKANILNLRKTPDLNAEILAKVSGGETVTILSENSEGWLEVNLNRNGRKVSGWIFGRNVARTN